MERNIIHINIVSFQIAVARALSPKLRSYPVAVASAGSSRRVLLDVSQQAYEAGIYRGMLADRARRRCPDLVVLNPLPEAYRRASRAVINEAARLSPFVESAGPGHLFIDLTGTERLFGQSIDVGARFRKRVKEHFKLDNAVGVASNKLVSKVATRVIKPAGLCSVMQGSEEEFMAPLPIRMLPGIDSKVIQQLYQFNLRNINEIHTVPQRSLFQVVGPVAADIYRFSHGVDNVPVRRMKAPAPSIEESCSLTEQTNDDHAVLGELLSLVVRAGMRLRKMGLAACRLRLTITHCDGSQNTRTARLTAPANGDATLFEWFSSLFKALYIRRVRLSSLAIFLNELSYPYGQVDLFDNTAREESLMKALDGVRTRFGPKIVTFWGIPGINKNNS
jgi:DNA polymerase-4